MTFLSGELNSVDSSRSLELIEISDNVERAKISLDINNIPFYQIYVEGSEQVLSFCPDNFNKTIFCSIPHNTKLSEVLKAFSLITSELKKYETISPAELFSIISNIQNREFWNCFKGTSYEDRAQRKIQERFGMINSLI
jgi:hypothetical protein